MSSSNETNCFEYWREVLRNAVRSDPSAENHWIVQDLKLRSLELAQITKDILASGTIEIARLPPEQWRRVPWSLDSYLFAYARNYDASSAHSVQIACAVHLAIAAGIGRQFLSEDSKIDALCGAAWTAMVLSPQGWDQMRRAIASSTVLFEEAPHSLVPHVLTRLLLLYSRETDEDEREVLALARSLADEITEPLYAARIFLAHMEAEIAVVPPRGSSEAANLA